MKDETPPPVKEDSSGQSRSTVGLGGGIQITLSLLEQKMWEMFELGKKDYRGAAKETVEEARLIFINGATPPNV